MLQPRRFSNAGAIIAACLLFICLLQNAVLGTPDNWHADAGDKGHLEIDKLDLGRVRRDDSGVTTLLLVNNDEARHIKGSRPEGLLTSTARTFVHDGTTTEYGTQIIGTSLDHGRYYAQLLQTSSRVYFGDQERVPTPKAKPDERVAHKSRYFPLNLENYINPTVFYDVRPAETILVYPTKADDSLNLVKSETSSEESISHHPPKPENGVEILVKENSGNIYYNDKVKEKERQAVQEVMRMQKANGDLLINYTRAFANDLPTYTVRHDFAPSGFSWSVPESDKEEVTFKVEKKFRSGKVLQKAAEKKLDTVTYLGFADFTTTVGDTVIVFMPNTKDAVTKPTQGAEPIPTSSKTEEARVMTTVKTFFSHSPGMVTRTIPGHNLSMQTSIPTQVAERQSKGIGENIELLSSFLSKEQDNFENQRSTVSVSSLLEPSETSPLLPVTKTSSVPTTPLATFATTVTKTFGSGGTDKPLGLLKSIGGTQAYNGTTTHFTSLLYGTYIGDTYTQVLKSSSSVFYLPASKGVAATKVLSQPGTVTPEMDTTTTEEPSREDLLTTLTDEGKTTNQVEETTPEPLNEDSEEDTEEKVNQTEEYITRIVPSTVYKTFTYLTTFFIPAADGTTTSIRSREVISSEHSYVTKVIETNLKHKEIELNEIKPTGFNLIDSSIDPEFLPPPTRVLAPEEVITTTEETETEEEPASTTTEISTEETTEDTTEDTTEQTDNEESYESSVKPQIRPSLSTSTESLQSRELTETKSTKQNEKDDENNEQEKEEDDDAEEDEKDEDIKEEVKTANANKEEATPIEDDEEEIEVIFKTIYTTYTYLTTFFQESTTSISSREVVVTNVITSTLENTPIPTARELVVDPTPTIAIKPTALVEKDDEEESPSIEPSSVAAEAEDTVTETPELKINGVKTFYTTFTYFTTLFEKGTTNVISRTEVVTNVVNPTVSALPASILQNEELLKSKFEMLLREQQGLRSQSSSTRTSVIYTTPTTTPESAPRSTISPTGTLRGKFGTLVRKSKLLTPGVLPSSNELDNSVGRFRLKGDKYDRTVIRKRIRTKSRLLPKSTTIEEGVTTIRLDPTPIDDDDKIILQTMITDVTKTTSGGNRQVKRIAPPEPVERPVLQLEDQISSESNTEEIEPSPTLLLQTSFTTFTYFTTVYKGTTSDVISRLETITNVVTETLKPDIFVTPALSPEDATLPITYFTTFTYWTTLYRDGSTVITSREETISNIVTPSVDATIAETPAKPEIETTIPVQSAVQPTETVFAPAVHTVFVPAFVPAAIPETTTEKEEEPSTTTTNKPVDDVTEGLLNKGGIEEKEEPTTFYTTYTYFTTSYVGESTVVKSRLETVTNIVTATPTISEITANDLQTGRAVNSAPGNQIQEDEKSSGISTSELQTGLLSTIVSTSVNDGVTTLYSTDIFGTFIDGLYAKILESTTKIATEIDIMPSKSLQEQKTGIVSINEGRIVDADGISTTFFTTKAIGTSIEQLYAQVVESTSSIVVDQDKKSALAQLNGGEENNDVFRTGLVRLIEGSIVQDGTVTHYESRVIGTVIDGRYAQIIESTSTFKIEPSIAPSVVIRTDISPTLQPSSSPPTIESSIAEDVQEDETEEEEDGDDEEEYDDKDKGRVKSRLTFQSRKRTFTPVIRPFASRNRPTFLPKKKTIGASSAQTITRAFTPTVTATLATKADGTLGTSRNRFGSGRRSSTGQPEIRPTVSASGRRFSGRSRSSVSSAVLSSSTYSSPRGRQSSVRITATPTLNLSSSRSRAFRVSSSRPILTSESRSNLSLRPRIRPTLSGFPGTRNTATNTPNQDDANDLTTVVTEEDLAVTVEEEGSPTTATTTTTTEDPNLARRNNNPLLRFRRPPLIPRATTSTTPKPTTTPAPRRGLLGGRNNRPTTPTFTTARPARTRPSNSFANRSQLQNRPRPVNSLFPPRGLFKKPTPQEEEKEEEEAEDEEVELEEDEDNNFEESSAKEVEAEVEDKVTEAPRGRSLNPVQIRPFRFQRPRTKRQVYEYGARNRQYTDSRYRRKRPQVQERFDYVDEEITEAPRVTPRTGRTYTGRTRTTTQAPSVPNPPRIRPTLASTQKSQFTIREKDTLNPRTTNFRQRSQTPSRRISSIQKPTESTLTRKPSRGRTTNQEYSRTPQRRNYNSRRTSTSSRGRGRFGEIEDTYTYQQPVFDGTITVTHRIPSEVTIPFVNGKSTEYRNVITAKPSLEVLGPHQYTISSINGGSIIFLNREVTGTLSNGVTEVTRFLIHETPTTSITFTPTTIRGRKTSFSHIVPSTVYDVENLVTTLQPQISANAPLANILLSQLLLGNLNLPPNQGIGLNPQSIPSTPSTEYKVRTTTYVTSVTDHTSTVLPITFRGKEILTTIVDSSVNVITATEYITDTIVVTPTLNPNNQINSLLLPALLQAQLLQPTVPQIPTPPNPFPFPDLESLQQEEPKLAKNDIRGERESEEIIEEEKPELRITSRKKQEKKQQLQPEPAKEVITLYVSGRRPGEFSTILSTVYSSDAPAAVRKRETLLDDIERLLVEASEVKQVRVFASNVPEIPPEASNLDDLVSSGITGPLESNEFNLETQSLESVLGDVSKHVIRSTSSKEVVAGTRKEDSQKVLSSDDNCKHNKVSVLLISTTTTLFSDVFISFLLGIRIIRNEEDLALGQNEPRYNLATKVMSNGVEVIVATDRNRPGEPEFLRLLSSTVTRPITLAPHTLINHMSMVLASEKEDKDLVSSLKVSNNFVTRTYYTTYKYVSTVTHNGKTGISTREKTVANVKTEEAELQNELIAPTSTREITLTESPSFQTEIFHTAYTYFNTIVDGEQPLVMTSHYTVSNTITANRDYFDMLEPSEVHPTTNTYLKTVEFTKTLTDGTDSQIVSTKNILTQVVVTEPFDRETVVKPMTTEVTKTYFVTYTYFSTYIDGDRTKVKSDVSVSSDVTIEKFYIKPKKTMTPKFTEKLTSVTRTIPMNILATKTYLTTFTYFTTLLQGLSGEKPETIVTTRTRVMQNVVTETLSYKNFNEEYLIKLQDSLEHHGNGNIITTATLKDGEQMEITVFKGGTAPNIDSHMNTISPSITTEAHEIQSAENLDLKKASYLKPTLSVTSTLKVRPNNTAFNDITAEALVAENNEVVDSTVQVSTLQHTNHRSNQTDSVLITPTKTETVLKTEVTLEDNQSVKKPPKHTSENPINFLNLTSLGINGINVLGPVFNAMAELINNNIKSKVNETAPLKKVQVLKKPGTSNVNPLLNFVSGLKATAEPKHKSTTSRTPVYIPVGSFAEDHETAESQSNILVTQQWVDTQGKNADKNRIDNGITILEGGIPISPGQIITTNSDVIIGRPGTSGPRPPNFTVKNDIPIDMKPPPPPIMLEIPVDDVIGQHSTTKNVKPAEYKHRQKHKPHDSGAADLNPPPAPPVLNVHRPITINHKPHEIVPYKPDHGETNIIPIPVHLMENYVNGDGIHDATEGPVIVSKPTPNAHIFIHSEQIHVNSNMEDRSTGHPLLVNIQPSQVANIVIPPGSSTALIINNESQHSLKGEVIDDPSPHPEPETVGFVGAEPVLRLENGDLTPPLQNKNHHHRPAIEPNKPYRQHPVSKVVHAGHHYYFTQNGDSHKVAAEIQNTRIPIYNQGHHYRDVVTNHKNPVKVGTGIYVDVLPPGHLPPRPDFSQTHGSPVPGKTPAGIPDNFSNHQSGLVHDVPLNAQVQLGSATSKDQSVKDILINAPKYDKIKVKYPSQHKGPNIVKKPPEDIAESLHPPPLPVITNNRKPIRPYPPFHPQSPTNFMVPPPQVSHRPNYKPPPEPHPSGPLMIPVGAGAPDQIYPYPRPEDIVIIPHNIHDQQSNHFDLDIGDENDPLQTEDGEELQESNSRPLLPGQLPPELERFNKTAENHYNSGIKYGVGRPYPALPRPQYPYYYHNKSSGGLEIKYGVQHAGDIYNEAEQIFGSKLNGNGVRVQRPVGTVQRPVATQETSGTSKVKVEASIDNVAPQGEENVSWIEGLQLDEKKPPRQQQQSTKRPPRPPTTPAVLLDNLWISHGLPQTTKRPADIIGRPKESEKKKPIQAHTVQPNSSFAEDKSESGITETQWNFSSQKTRPRPYVNATIPDKNIRIQFNLTSHSANSSTGHLTQPDPNRHKTPGITINHPDWIESISTQEFNRVTGIKKPDKQQVSQSDNIWAQQPSSSQAKPGTEKVRIPTEIIVVDPQQTNDWIGSKPTNIPQWTQPNSTSFPQPTWHQEDFYRNRTSPSKSPSTTADINNLLSPPKATEVMGLSPPPPERPRRPSRPQRPKPPFKFEISSTPRVPIAIENDFPPVRSPDFNKKPIKPQDIFPPKLPENFIHHVPEYAIRTPKPKPPPRQPVTSMPINIPETQQIADANEINKVYGSHVDINGHSKPLNGDDSLTPVKRPRPQKKPETVLQFDKPADKSSRPAITPSRTVTTTPTGNVVWGSETVFEPEEFSKYKTPIIKETTRKMVTTLITTGTTTIFGDIYTPRPSEPKPTEIGKPAEIAPTYTTTLTVTTTMTTVVHSIGQKPSTKTIVLTKTILSTVVDKVTETQTLVKPTTATITQTHTVATTKTALIVSTAIRPTSTKKHGGTLKPEIFVADPHSKDTMTISVSTSMNDKKTEEKRKHIGRRPETDNDSILVVMTNKHPTVNLSNEHYDTKSQEVEKSGVFLGGVFHADKTKTYKTPVWRTECVPECRATRNERCQKVDSEMKCMCRPGFARMFPDRPCMPTYTYNMKLLLDKSGMEEDLVQSESTNYVQLKALTKEGLDRMIMQSDLRDIFHGVSVNGFESTQKKMMVDFYVQLSENTDESRLMNVFKKTLRHSNYSLGGTQLYAAREGDALEAEDFNECLNPKFHDCSENARCFNLRGTYTCSCKEGFTDLSENSLFPGRMCSDMIGCEYCGYHGTCYTRDENQIMCECFQWYSGERCRINLKVLLIALVTIGSVLLALLLVCGVLTCLKRKSKSSSASRANGSSGYLRYRGPPTQSLDKRAMIAADSSSESSVENLPYISPPPPPPPSGTFSAKKKPVLRQNMKGPAPRPKELASVEQQDRSVTVMIPRAKYRPVPPMSPLLTMSTFSPDKHIHRTSAQISSEQKLINYLEGNTREGTGNEQKSNQKICDGPRSAPAFKKEQRVFEYEYKTSNMQINDGTSSGERRSSKHGDSEKRFRRHSDSTHLNSENSRNFQHRKYSAGALVSAGFEVSATVGLQHNDFDTSEDEHSGILNTGTMKSNRSQFTTLNRTGDHKTMSEARSYDETTIHPPTRTLKTNYSGSSPSSRVNNDEGHTMVERDLGSTFIMPESHLFKPERDRGSDISTFDSL